MSNEPGRSSGAESEGRALSRRQLFGKLLKGRPDADSERGSSALEAVSSMGDLTRRKLLKILAGGAVAAGLVAEGMYPVVRTLLLDLLTDEQNSETIHDQMNYLEERYGCTIVFGVPAPWGENREIRFGKLDPMEKETALEGVRMAFGKYPPEYVRQYAPKIIFTKYRKLGTAASANSWGNEHTIIVFIGNRHSSGAVEENIHHELGHVADTADGLEAMATESGLRSRLKGAPKEAEIGYPIYVNNASWAAMNPDGMNAYTDERHWGYLLERFFKSDSKCLNGFASSYGQRNPDEDEAEFTEELMTMDYQDGASYVKERSAKDPVFSAKIARVKEYMFRRSGGRMNERYWKDLEAGRVDEKYWNIH